MLLVDALAPGKSSPCAAPAGCEGAERSLQEAAGAGPGFPGVQPRAEGQRDPRPSEHQGARPNKSRDAGRPLASCRQLKRPVNAPQKALQRDSNSRLSQLRPRSVKIMSFPDGVLCVKRPGLVASASARSEGLRGRWHGRGAGAPGAASPHGSHPARTAAILGERLASGTMLPHL